MTNPIGHDKTRKILGIPSKCLKDDRQCVFEDGKSIKEVAFTSAGLTTAQARSMVNHSDDFCGTGMANLQVGLVDMNQYAQWLQHAIPGVSVKYLGSGTLCILLEVAWGGS